MNIDGLDLIYQNVFLNCFVLAGTAGTFASFGLVASWERSWSLGIPWIVLLFGAPQVSVV
jgi:hypothetical protein